MSAQPIRKFAATNRLAEMIGLPGGKTAREAVRDAGEAIERYRPEVAADIDSRIEELESLAAQAAPAPEAVYRLSAGIIEHAGLFGMSHVGQAAYSLCELVDRLEQRGTWDVESVAVHASSLRLLRTLPGDAAEQREQLLRGLQAVTAKAAPARRSVRAD